MLSVLFILSCAIVNALSGPAISLTKCKPGDDACVIKSVEAAIPLVLHDNAEVGAENLDPMFHTLIDGNLSILKFKLFNTTVTGFKSCNVEKAKFDEEQQTLGVDAVCPGFDLRGQYDINGRLIVLPVEGTGDFSIVTKKYRLKIKMELNTVTGSDGKAYRHVKNFKVDPEALEGVIFDFKNLFNGQKDLADAVHKFANESWKEVVQEVQGPVFVSCVKKIVKNANKYLKTLPIDEYTAQ